MQAGNSGNDFSQILDSKNFEILFAQAPLMLIQKHNTQYYKYMYSLIS